MYGASLFSIPGHTHWLDLYSYESETKKKTINPNKVIAVQIQSNSVSTHLMCPSEKSLNLIH